MIISIKSQLHFQSFDSKKLLIILEEALLHSQSSLSSISNIFVQTGNKGLPPNTNIEKLSKTYLKTFKLGVGEV